MKTQETIVTVLHKETKKGTTNDGRAWSIDEYTLLEETERDDGSIAETTIAAQTTGSVGELTIGAKYKVVIYITSRKSERDGKTSYWPSFRVTRAEMIGEAPTHSATAGKPADEIDDGIPF